MGTTRINFMAWEVNGILIVAICQPVIPDCSETGIQPTKLLLCLPSTMELHHGSHSQHDGSGIP